MPKQFYNYVKSRTKSSQPVANLTDNEGDRIVTLESEKAELRRRHYCSVFTRDNGVLPDCPHTVLRDTVCDISVDDCDIIRSMRQTNSNSAPGPNGIHPKFINNLYPFLIKSLKGIFNPSLSTGIVPKSLKFR